MTTLNFNMFVFIALVIASSSFYSCAGKTKHVVGDDFGWNRPKYPEFYAEYSSVNTFTVGDSLYFNFLNESHNVATVSPEAYHECNLDDAQVVIKTGPGSIDLSTEGVHHYVSTINDDCQVHQKLAILVHPSPV
ncbi:cupredoxin [Artemisia annua]|uniref:Cupredoxin n=1 Tax=Artemisia annua TaxID=35608 RepID=A0A2U1P115_ARTAN|nr:cupredoxin [Artemisia annua]